MAYLLTACGSHGPAWASLEGPVAFDVGWVGMAELVQSEKVVAFFTGEVHGCDELSGKMSAAAAAADSKGLLVVTIYRPNVSEDLVGEYSATNEEDCEANMFRPYVWGATSGVCSITAVSDSWVDGALDLDGLSNDGDTGTAASLAGDFTAQHCSPIDE